MLRRLWDGFSNGMMAIGHFISRNIVTPVLFSVLGLLFSIFAKAGDPLRLKLHHGGSVWIDRSGRTDSLDQARSLH
jgi:hypothetical protein